MKPTRRCNVHGAPGSVVDAHGDVVPVHEGDVVEVPVTVALESPLCQRSWWDALLNGQPHAQV
jgi:hypothetical protein